MSIRLSDVGVWNPSLSCMNIFISLYIYIFWRTVWVLRSFLLKLDLILAWAWSSDGNLKRHFFNECTAKHLVTLLYSKVKVRAPTKPLRLPSCGNKTVFERELLQKAVKSLHWKISCFPKSIESEYSAKHNQRGRGWWLSLFVSGAYVSAQSASFIEQLTD